MATYRLCVYAAKRTDQRSGTAMAAYRACEAVTDYRTGEQHDYTRKSGLLYSEIIAPETAPEWARDRSQLWNRSEAAHKRGDAVVCREIQLSLPYEMDAVQRREVTTEFAQHLADRYNIAVDTCLHAPNKDGDQRNYHAHLMLCTRPFDESKSQGLGNNVRAFDAISHQKAGTENHVTQWRETWETMLNRALERANVRDSDGVQVVVDHRSYKDRDSDLEPQLKEGPAATAKHRRGEQTDRGQINDDIKARNAERMDAEELRRRQAQNITANDVQQWRFIDDEPAPEPIPRQAQNIAAPQAARELTASNDNGPDATASLVRMAWESDAEFAEREDLARDYIKAKQQEQKLELKPKGPTWGY